MTGIATHTISQGKVVFADGDLRAERGAGRHIKRPPFGAQFDALARKAALAAPVAVER